jgi:hypothetical protein
MAGRWFACPAAVHHQDPYGIPYLGCRQTDTVAMDSHGVKQVLDLLLDIGIQHSVDRLRGTPQGLVRIPHNLKYTHDSWILRYSGSSE